MKFNVETNNIFFDRLQNIYFKGLVIKYILYKVLNIEIYECISLRQTFLSMSRPTALVIALLFNWFERKK